MFDIREPSIEVLQDIVKNSQAVKFRYHSNKKLILMDLTTANVLISVYNALGKEEAKQKFKRMLTASPVTLDKLVKFCYSRV